MPKKPKSFFQLSDAGRAADVAEYNRGVSFDETRPLSAADRSRWERAQASHLPQTTNDDLARVLIAIDPKLLAKAHVRAKKEGKSLSAFISDLLRDAEPRSRNHLQHSSPT